MRQPENIPQSSPGTLLTAGCIASEPCLWLQHQLEWSRLTNVPLAMQAHSYAEAWELATANRVDLNIMVDLGSPDFVEHVEEFVRDVQVLC